MSETTSSEPATGPVATAAEPAAAPPAYAEPPRHSRLTAVAAWVGIVAGGVFIVAVVFFSGFFLGAHSGGRGGWHHGGDGDREFGIIHKGPPPMFPMGPPRGEFERPFPFGPGGPNFQGPQGPGPGQPSAPSTTSPRPS